MLQYWPPRETHTEMKLALNKQSVTYILPSSTKGKSETQLLREAMTPVISIINTSFFKTVQICIYTNKQSRHSVLGCHCRCWLFHCFSIDIFNSFTPLSSFHLNRRLLILCYFVSHMQTLASSAELNSLYDSEIWCLVPFCCAAVPFQAEIASVFSPV